MVEGTRIHQHIQKQYKEGDRKEVYLKTEIAHEGLIFRIDGRCDGLLTGEDGSVTVEEIKSTAGPLEPAFEGREVHWAQAYMYAYMICLAQELTSIEVKLTYVRRGGEEQRSLYRQLSKEELIAFAVDTVAKYAPYAELMVRHEAQKEASIRGLSFPLPNTGRDSGILRLRSINQSRRALICSPKPRPVSAKRCPPSFLRSKHWEKARQPGCSI